LFAPWEQLLSLIQVTEDEVPVELKEIAKVVNTDMEHAELLLKLLLNENELIGIYDEQRQIYTKGVGIDSYIDSILTLIKDGKFVDT
jgi:hypothetical protein